MKLKLGKLEITEKTNILSIEVPEEMKRNVPTGFKHIDRLFSGDGVTPSVAALVTGTPGAGKTTLMLQLADAVTGEGHLALLNTGEESLYQVRRVVDRLNLRNGFIVGQDRDVADVLEHLRSLQKEAEGKFTPNGLPQKVFLFQDSLQCLEISSTDASGKKKKGRPLSGDKASVLALERIVEWCKETYGVAFIIGQVNKGGDFAGKNGIKHTVDAHLHLGWLIDINYPDGHEKREVPIAEMTKNRFGPSGLFYKFEMTENGIRFRNDQ